ncbi:MAG: DNA gyrase/topoisomerase IV subunit A, partial [Muribaculaceae bacterium]|nr:DNA gyrase/topoisomerase IV subunit A [Muribaculaceae bacterium]
METAIRRLDTLFDPFKPSFFRPLTDEDLIHLWEIKMGRILKFNSEKADQKIAKLNEDIARIEYDLEHIVEFTEKWYLHLKEKYGAKFPRRTVIRGFDSIEAAKVAEANKRFYHDEEGGFIGTGLKDKKFLFTCSDIDDILVIYRNGKYKIVRVQEKLFVDKNIIHIGIFKKNDKRTIYNVIYLNGKGGSSYMKRFYITGLTRDKEYDITKGLKGSKILWLTCNPNGEAETVRVLLKDEPDTSGRKPRNRRLSINFSDLAVKGKESLGNLVTKYQIESKGITLEKKGASTLGGREVWFDRDVLRLNYDGRGESLGIFHGEDLVLVITKNGEFFTSSFADTNHYEDNILKIEKFDPHKVWTLVLNDASLGYPYVKRFSFEPSPKPQRFVGSDEQSSIILLTDTPYPRIKVEFGGADAVRPALELEAEEFIGVKSFKAKGKRLSNYTVESVEELEPTRFPEINENQDNADMTDNSDEQSLSENPGSSDLSDNSEPSLFNFND